MVRLSNGLNRDDVHSLLASRGIATGRYFAPIHLQPSWRAQPAPAASGLALTESVARRTLALPFFNRITPTQQQEVAQALDDVISPAQRTGSRAR